MVGGQSRIVRAAEVVFYPESRIDLGHKTDFYQKTPFADSTLQSLLVIQTAPSGSSQAPRRRAGQFLFGYTLVYCSALALTCSSDAEPRGECNVGGGKKNLLRSLESRSASGDSSSF